MGKYMEQCKILLAKMSALKIAALIILGMGIMTSPSHAQEQSRANAHQFSFKALSGEDMPLSAYKGQVLFIVNTASQCGFTGQYEGLQSLHEQYADQGLVVIGVPCNQFGGQEPGDADKIKEFTKEKYGITFPMTAKYAVKGEDAHPFFKWASEQKKSLLFGSSPKWNFHKYLIGKNGEFIASFGSQAAPMSSRVVKAVEAALAQQG